MASIEIPIVINVDEEALEKAAANALEEARKAGDFVLITRCGKCCHKKEWYTDEFGDCVCGKSGLYPKGENDFCSYGEAKEEV